MLWPVFYVVVECSAVKCLPALCRETLSQKALNMFPRIQNASVACLLENWRSNRSSVTSVCPHLPMYCMFQLEESSVSL